MSTWKACPNRATPLASSSRATTANAFMLAELRRRLSMTACSSCSVLTLVAWSTPADGGSLVDGTSPPAAAPSPTVVSRRLHRVASMRWRMSSVRAMGGGSSGMLSISASPESASVSADGRSWVWRVAAAPSLSCLYKRGARTAPRTARNEHTSAGAIETMLTRGEEPVEDDTWMAVVAVVGEVRGPPNRSFWCEPNVVPSWDGRRCLSRSSAVVDESSRWMKVGCLASSCR
mmetsp:Transcript_28519/g.82174  ORF Transcript_28519/g.82174 Transcript_28519/m.82174 type:complete len:232 (+) Transcript_28519:1431-2126(+)